MSVNMLLLLIFCFLKSCRLVISYTGEICPTSRESTPFSDRLRWNFGETNDGCALPGGGRAPCTDMRICKLAVASLLTNGTPPSCGYVESVTKVCCGLPLVLGPSLIDKVDEEKARRRECGRKSFSLNLSPTENEFFQYYAALPDVDTSDKSRFNPPIELPETVEAPNKGSTSRQAEYPWMVTIFSGNTFRCGGSLIDRSHVLSAAHCFVTENGEAEDPLQFTVKVGDIYLDGGVSFSVVSIKIHDEYKPPEYYNDIAILTLEKELLTPLAAHICLPDETIAAMDLTGKNTTSLGWDNTESETGQYINPMAEEKRTKQRQVKSFLNIVDGLPVVSTTQCRYDFQQANTESSLPRGITNDFICVGLKGRKRACQKDFGGSLMYRNNYANLPDNHPDIPWVLMGIASSSPYSCDDPKYPGVYTRASSYMDWIKENS